MVPRDSITCERLAWPIVRRIAAAPLLLVALLDPMIRRSDNRAADALHARVGLRSLDTLARRARMGRFVAHPVWGGSIVTAADQARFFLRVDRMVPDCASRSPC